jgi:hypothetical protein
MGPAQAGWVRNAVGSLAVLAVVAAAAFGLPVLDRGMAAGRPVAPGVPYDVGGGVTVIPPAAAWVDVTRTRPGLQRGTALFVVSGVRLAIAAGPYRGSLAEAADRLRAKITSAPGYQMAGQARPFATDQGVAGLLGPFNSSGRLGEYAVVVDHDREAEVTVSGPEEDLRRLQRSLDASLASVAFVGGG